MGRGKSDAHGYLTKIIHHKLHYLKTDGNLIQLVDEYKDALVVTRDTYKARYKSLGYNFSKILNQEEYVE